MRFSGLSLQCYGAADSSWAEGGAMSKSLVQEQFGATAQTYLTSKPHAQGKSLDRLIELTQPKPDWQVLDVATGAGHTAYAFAPHVARVWATDITEEMLALVRKETGKRGLTNVRVAHAKAEALPFEDDTFDLVTCRIAPHHFESIALFLDEARRVLKRGGTFALVDNVVPEGSVGDYVNAFERFRDPSHLRAWPMQEWRDAFAQHGFAIAHEEQLGKTMEFSSWAARHDATMQQLLRAMLAQATPDVAAVLAPQETKGDLTFRLSEGVFIARRADAG
jgi:ubiquinone/menaquinone biosynthesis C-methylase UbiE